MRISRIFTPQALAVGCELELESDSCRRLTQVLRLKPGSAVTLFNGNGHDYQGQLIITDRRHCRVAINTKGSEEPPAPLRIELALGISKGERMDIAVQKAVELGVNRIHPLITEFSNLQQSGGRQEKKARHWGNIIISACEQSGRRRLPELLPIQPFGQWLNTLRDDGIALLLNPAGGQSLIGLSRPASGSRVQLLAGPEGGLSSSEIERAVTKGFQSIRLGPRVLRTETAPLAAIAAIQVLWGDFS